MMAETLPTTTPFASAWQKLQANGYHVLPISPMSKAPSEFVRGHWQPMTNWQQFRGGAANEIACKVWATWPACNIGVLTGTPAGNGMMLACVDYDSDDPEVLDKLTSSIPRSSVTKMGRRGFSAFYLVPNGTKGFKTPMAELLTDTRQTVIPPSIHVDTGKPYRWTSGLSLLDVKASGLPELTADDVKAFRDVLQELLAKPLPVAKAEIVQFPAGEETVWRRVNNSAYGNLDAWVPELGLHKLRKTQQGYQAVAHWRASTSGRPISERSPNLSILQNQGAKDFGDGRSYTALDLVKEALDLDFDKAFEWLGAKLGMLDAPLPLVVPVEIETKPAPVVEAAAVAVEHIPDVFRPPGLLGEISDLVYRSSRRPSRVLSLGAGVAVLGSLLSGAVQGPTGLGTHLYMIGIAASGAGKDKPLKMVNEILSVANCGDLIGPSEFMSMQAVVRFLMRKPRSCCTMDEFGAFLKRVGSAKAAGFEKGISKILRQAWSTNFETMITTEWAGTPAQEIDSPALTIYGASTPNEFFEALGSEDVVNGFLNRFMILEEINPGADCEPEFMAIPPDIGPKLAAFRLKWFKVESARGHRIGEGVKPKKMGWGAGSRDVYLQLVTEIDLKISERPNYADLWRRTAEIALRLACICAAGQGLVELDKASMAWAAELALWSSGILSNLAVGWMAENETQKLHNKIVRLIKKHGGKISHRDLMRALQGGIKSNDLKGAMENLVASELIKTKKAVPLSGGPPSVVYEYLG